MRRRGDTDLGSKHRSHRPAWQILIKRRHGTLSIPHIPAGSRLLAQCTVAESIELAIGVCDKPKFEGGMLSCISPNIH